MSIKSIQRIEWRREKVREYSIKGYSQRDIAAELQVSLRLIEKDLAYLRLKAKENISKYIDEYLPSEYENSLNGLNNIMKEAWTISTDSDSDKRERMQALSLAKECYAMKLDLLSSATVVDRAVKFVDRNRVKGAKTLAPLDRDYTSRNDNLTIDSNNSDVSEELTQSR